MTTPDSLPILSVGSHHDPKDGACFMEWASILAGEEFSDTPACTDIVITYLAQSLNDHSSDEQRAGLAHLIPSVVGTNDLDEAQRLELAKRWMLHLMIWCDTIGGAENISNTLGRLGELEHDQGGIAARVAITTERVLLGDDGWKVEPALVLQAMLDLRTAILDAVALRTQLLASSTQMLAAGDEVMAGLLKGTSGTPQFVVTIDGAVL